MTRFRFAAVSTARLRASACIAGSMAALALLSACGGPQISAQQETTRYLTHARRSYTPPGPDSDPWGPYIVEASTKYDVPERWIREVMHQESGGHLYGRGGDLITSGAGAMGLMQVMPGTYDELRARYSELGGDPFDPHNNILAGTAYIREMYDIYGSPGFLAAYNAGPGRLDDYLTRSRTLPGETRRYVANIGPKIAGSFPNTRSPGEQYAMNSLPMPAQEAPRYSAAVAMALNQVPPKAAAEPPPAIQAVEVAQASTPPRAEPPAGVITLSQPRYITLAPQPLEVAEAPEPARYEPQRAERLADAPAQSAFRPMQVARAAEPPRVLPTPPRYQAFEPAHQFAALTPVAPRPGGFNLVSPANAAPVAVRRGGVMPGTWAVQVGAFENANLASAATVAARDTARDVLGGARPTVSSVRQLRGTLYRARLVGLSRDAAAHACERLVRIRTNCMIVSPNAQS